MDTRDAVLRRIELAERQDARTHDQFFEDTLTALRELFGAELAEQARGAVTGWSGTGSFSCPVSEVLRLLPRLSPGQGALRPIVGDSN